MGDLDIDLSTPSNDLGTGYDITSEIPQVREVPQTGAGLNSVKESLSLFNKEAEIPYPSHLAGSQAEKDQVYAEMRQRRLETDAVQSAVDRWRMESEKLKQANIDQSAQKLGPILWEWQQQLAAKLQSELGQMVNAGKQTGQVDETHAPYVAYLKALDAERLAAVTILSTLTTMNKFGIEKGTRLGTLVLQLGQAVEEEVTAQRIETQKLYKQTPLRASMVERLLSNRKSRVGRIHWKEHVKELQEISPDIVWPTGTEAGVGAFLISVLLDVAKVRAEKHHPNTKEKFVSIQSAYQHTYQLEKGRRIGYVHLNPVVAEKIRREPVGDLIAKHLPMVSKPKPWTGFRDGGFLTQKTCALRVKGSDQAQLSYAKAAIARGDLDQVLSGLNILGMTGWNVNRGVFNVMLEAWNSGEAVANLAPETFHANLPEQPPVEDKEARKKWHDLKRELNNKKSGLHSERCFQNFQMETARAYLNETFYLPHNLDFRGRAYPMTPYFNQMGADNCRGLLIFSEGKPLGEQGMRWLKIHLANVFGFDKASLQERVDFTMDHLDDILDSANNSLNGRRWWLKAEDPWQCLGACMELRDALASPDPTKFVSHLPIHQDGSCNGLQHYAALGGDVVGARQVNLEPSDRPSDVYTGVSEFVKEDIAKEAAQGVEIAKLLEGKVTRKIVKQTVMTNVYGVTFLGAIRQVRKQLDDYYPELKDAPFTHGPCSTYIARKIFKALGSMFSGAHSIQYWLGDCASRISQSLTPEQVTQIINDPELNSKTETQRRRLKKEKDPLAGFNSTVIWTTPLKLPVVQPYRETKARRVKTSLQDINIRDPHVTDVVSKRKQLQAFPPNFIHSLDATHMLLSANKCHELGLTFSAVHDSFWTHAGDIDTMNRVLRDEFVRMHSDDIMQRLAAEFQIRYSKNVFLAQLKRDSAVAKAITAHRNKTKKHPRSAVSKLSELVLEHKRLTLLASDDPAKQEEGRAMVTPASIFENFPNADDAFNTKQSLGETAIGHVPKDIESSEADKSTIDKLSDELNSTTPGQSQDEFGVPDDAEFDVPVDDATAPAEASANAEAGAEKPKKQYSPTPVWVWLPLTFRAIPEKVCISVHLTHFHLLCVLWTNGIRITGRLRRQEIEA